VAIHKLTALTIERARRKGRYGDGGGLYLDVAAGGTKVWLFRYKRFGKTRFIGLGSLANGVSVTEARAEAARLREHLRQGRDPLVVRRQERVATALEAAKTMTFDEAAAGYMDSHRAGWRSVRYPRLVTSILKRFASPVFGKLPVAAIDTGLVMKAVEPLWFSRTTTAARLRAAVESVLDWAKARGYRDGDNPARWRGHLDKLLPARSKVRIVEHMPSMPYADMPAFMAALRQRTDTAARALDFTILTAVRTGDIRGQEREYAPPMRWEHVDLDAALWTIPKGKNGKEHRVPLSPSAVALLRGLPREGDIVFPRHRPDKPISKGAMLRVLAEMGRNVTAHGMRASFKTWASEQTHAPREVVEACLAHTISDALEAAYRRGDFLDKRRKLMEAWAVYCAAQKTGEVVAFRREGSRRVVLPLGSHSRGSDPSC